MRRWFVPLIAAVLTSAVGVAINIATDLKDNVWAWVAVVALTLVIAVVAVVSQGPAGRDAPTAGRPGGNTQNTIAGNVTGTVVQAGDIHGPVTLGHPDKPHQDDTPS